MYAIMRPWKGVPGSYSPCSFWLWYFLKILTIFGLHIHCSIPLLCNVSWSSWRVAVSSCEFSVGRQQCHLRKVLHVSGCFEAAHWCRAGMGEVQGQNHVTHQMILIPMGTFSLQVPWPGFDPKEKSVYPLAPSWENSNSNFNEALLK